MLDADYASTPTEFLAERCRALGQRTVVLRNGLAIAPSPVPAPGREGELRLGYFSGSLTHQRDFAVLLHPLVHVLGATDARLLLVGELDVSEFPELHRFLHRIEHRPLMSWDDPAAMYAEVDVNLAPLEADNPYTQAKSELKYIEAASAGVPTVATPTNAFRYAIRHGENGLLASCGDEWRIAMLTLLSDAALRHRLGQAAREDVALRYTPSALGTVARETYAGLIRHARAQRGAPDDALVVSLLLPADLTGAQVAQALETCTGLVERGHEVRVHVDRSGDGLGEACEELVRAARVPALRFGGSPSDLAACDALLPATAAMLPCAREHASLAATTLEPAALDAGADEVETALRERLSDGGSEAPAASAATSTRGDG